MLPAIHSHLSHKRVHDANLPHESRGKIGFVFVSRQKDFAARWVSELCSHFVSVHFFTISYFYLFLFFLFFFSFSFLIENFNPIVRGSRHHEQTLGRKRRGDKHTEHRPRYSRTPLDRNRSSRSMFRTKTSECSDVYEHALHFHTVENAWNLEGEIQIHCTAKKKATFRVRNDRCCPWL